MIFGFRRKNHRLPKFPPTLIPAFARLSEALSVEAVSEFPTYIDQRLAELEDAAGHNYRINIKLAAQIAERCNFLVSVYEAQQERGRALIVGAVRYFAIGEDAVSENGFASGLDDDAKVVNHVLEEIGIHDRFIDLSY